MFIEPPPIVGANRRTEALVLRQKNVVQRVEINTAHFATTNVRMGINGKTFQRQISRASKLTAPEDIEKPLKIFARLKGLNLREICVVNKVGASVRWPQTVVARKVLLNPKNDIALTNILILGRLVRLKQNTKISLVLTLVEKKSKVAIPIRIHSSIIAKAIGSSKPACVIKNVSL